MLEYNSKTFSILEQLNVPLVDRMALSLVEDEKSIFFNPDPLYSGPIREFAEFKEKLRKGKYISIQNGETLILSHLNQNLPILAYAEKCNPCGENEVLFYLPKHTEE